MAFASLVTGNFKGLLLFTLIVLVHELGHIIAALYYKWKIEKILLLPFGALTIFHEKLNRPIEEEFIILISGPLVQIIFTFLLSLNYHNPDIQAYSNLILFFNLLPIYPLDGSKLVNLLLNKLTSFKKSHILTIYISFLTIFLLFLNVQISLVFLLIIIFITIKVIDELKKHHALFNLFLFERYNYNFHFSKHKTIKNVKQMKRDYTHLFKIDNNYKTEKEVLSKRFDFKRKM